MIIWFLVFLVSHRISSMLPSWFQYLPDAIPNADELFVYFSRMLDRQQYPIRMFGKMMMQPRLVAFYADPWCIYSYSQTKLTGSWWDTKLQEMNTYLQTNHHLQFNSVLCNLYRDGNDSMGRHSDDEKELGSDPLIASITLWAQRVFQIRHKQTKQRHDILLEHGSILIMVTQSQIEREHCLPKSKHHHWPHINLTWRKIFL